ncbi:hypothetical protein ACVIHI_001497 [Bradyrhizobium sp. USDA 4524]|uniref:hypothetical protein n=1 Tax=unclassified Bradyrhizobium TaxID=2631580 RepID=UPI00209E53EF|nr:MULTISPECIES: hypothetical protein [unclassified Bradyrhizobium]MCP1837127.1 hypothetical protein [Bradyrhizobium sp. USDA 4538]MCP1906146.1 hypothetical protein [Bradyrhizobium sp. USDA 4537]MCP1988200.1 hypothetical protein [Bradyrhizobium sp. USDA 4539]
MTQMDLRDDVFGFAPTQSADSSAREKLVEHLFLGELLRALWLKNIRGVEVLRPEVDSGGYDLALEFQGVVRHIQLKSSHRDARRGEITANVKLLDRPAACILWIYFDPDTLRLGPFLWFGGAPHERIPELGGKIARHTKHNAQREKALRSGHRVIAKSRFMRLDGIDEVIQRLLG